MNKDNVISSIEIGYFLSRIREQAGIKQAELAKKITWSPAMLSRIEMGDRPLSSDELQTIVEGIHTPEALKLSEVLQRQWSILPRPPLSHPDQDILWAAEQAAQKLSKLSERTEKKSFQRRLEAYIEHIQKLAVQLLKREHQIAFIGSIGIGKSTAICQLANLTMPNPNGNFDAVLEVGSGGITVCEVHVLSGSEYEIRIEPRTDEEIRTDIRDFAVNLLSAIDVKKSVDRDDADNDSQGISKEIQRALRNMSGLIRRSEKQAVGKPIRTDKAKELAQQFPEERDLIIEIMARMELHKRDRRSVLYNSSTGKPPLKWLKDTFELINNGRHPDFTLPKRIEVVVKDQLLEHSECLVRIIDTKGIDNKETAARPDLEGHLKDLHTITVLCSGFNDAPARNPWQLLERAKDIGIQTLELNSSLLVLPHTGEALKEKDEDSGQYVESEEEGYERKAETVEDALEPLGLRRLPVYFFNAYQDNVEHLREFLNQRLTAVRDSFRVELNNTIDDTERLLANHEQEQVQAVIHSAGKRIESWVKQHETLPTLNIHVQDDLINAMNQAYASTIRATIWRKGKWDKLDYCHHLSYGSRLLAARLLREHESKFKDFCMTLIGDAEYLDAQDFIKQAENTLSSAFQLLLSKVALTGENYFSNELASSYAAQLWDSCEAEYGQGYRGRVVQHNKAWFNEAHTQKLEQDLYIFIEREWKLALEKVSALIETD